MKKHNVLFYLAILGFVSCSSEAAFFDESEKDNDENIESAEPLFYKSNISKADFASKVQGFAWKFVDGQGIDIQTGEKDTYSFYKGGYDEDGNFQMQYISGFTPIHPYFVDDHQVTSFFHVPFEGNFYSNETYLFNEDNSCIYVEKNEETGKSQRRWMYVDKIDADTLYVIQTFEFEKTYYVYNKYVKMTQEELEGTIKNHKEEWIYNKK